MDSLKPAWQRINELFERFGLPHPPTRLRDELVMFNANTEPLATARAAGDAKVEADVQRGAIYHAYLAGAQAAAEYFGHPNDDLEEGAWDYTASNPAAGS